MYFMKLSNEDLLLFIDYHKPYSSFWSLTKLYRTAGDRFTNFRLHWSVHKSYASYLNFDMWKLSDMLVILYVFGVVVVDRGQYVDGTDTNYKLDTLTMSN